MSYIYRQDGTSRVLTIRRHAWECDWYIIDARNSSGAITIALRGDDIKEMARHAHKLVVDPEFDNGR